MQRAVPFETMAEFDVDAQCSAVWTMRQPPEEPVIAKKRSAEEAGETSAEAFSKAAEEAAGRPHRFVLVAGQAKTMLLEATEEIAEISKETPLDTAATTMCAGSVLKDRLIVQVTRRQLIFVWASNPRSKDVPPPIDLVHSLLAAEVGYASICDPYISIAFKDGTCRIFLAGDSDGGTTPCVSELATKLPEAVSRVSCASLFRNPRDGKVLLVAVTVSAHGTLHILELDTMKILFSAGHLTDVPPVLRAMDSEECENGRGCDLDHLRALTDPCAPLPKGTRADADGGGDKSTSNAVISAELVEVGVGDAGPTLIVVVAGRPLLIYRSFIATSGDKSNDHSFPFHFALWEHTFLGVIESPPTGPYQPVAAFRHPGGNPSGAIIVPPHAGTAALWLTAARNQLFVHPLPGDQVRSFAPLHAPCSEKGFFALSQGTDAVAAQVLVLSTLEGLAQDASAFELRAPVPHVRVQLQHMPQCLATRPADNAIALAVSETVYESTEPAGPNVDEDPLSEDWTIIRAPPVEVESPAPVPRLQHRHELWIDEAKNLGKLGKYKFSFDADEHVLCLAWVTLPSFPSPSLAVGTGVNTGEDLTCRGRLLIFSTKDKDSGVLPAAYQRSLKWPVTVVGQWGEYFVHSEGFKLYFERWENGSFNKLAFFDGSMCITSLAQIKNFLLLGDLRKGLDFAQWKEDVANQTRSLRRLSRSSPSANMTVLACDFLVCGKSLGLVALDHRGSAHLFQYTPHSDGREGDQMLRSSATFSMGSICRASLRLQIEPGVQALFMASNGGELFCLKPIDEQVYRTATTLLGMLCTRLPFRCGLNPRAFRHHDGPTTLVAPRKNIEDTLLLRLYAFLSSPLQKLISDKMRLSVLSMLRTTSTCASCQLHALRPEEPAPETLART
jgi:hypothetical protein